MTTVRDYKVKTIDALHRGLLVLEVLQDMRAASLHDLYRETGIPKSTLIRIVHTLHARGMVWQRMADGAFLPSHTLQRRAPIDDADWLGEIASPVLERLCQRVPWPSVLSVPRADYMEVIETNSPKASFDLIVGPIGARIDMLRSSSGRAYLAYCDSEEREAVIHRLRSTSPRGPRTAWDAAWIDNIIETTRQRGYGVRARDYVGLYNDDRASIAMPVIVTGNVLCCINLTWRVKIMSVQDIVRLHIDSLRDAVRTVESRLVESLA